LNLRQLEYVVSIADEANISHAAEKLFISRPALNHYLLNLEDELGLPLFTRIKRRLVPTYAGNTYISAARKILDLRKQTYKILQDLKDSKIGFMNLGISRGYGNIIFNRVFPQFHKNYPEFSINLTEGDVQEIDEAVLDGRLDLAITGSGSFSTALERMIIVKSEILLVLPPGHPLEHLAAPKDSPYNTIDVHLLKADNFIFRTHITKIRKIIDDYLEKKQFTPHKIIECLTSDMVYNFIKNGLGPGFLNEIEMNPNDGLARFSLSPRQYWNPSFVYRKETQFTKAENYFIQSVKKLYS